MAGIKRSCGNYIVDEMNGAVSIKEDLLMRDISVVIPVYNGASLLASCIDSINSAGKRVSEIIIVDDGSIDETLKMANNLADKDSRIKVVHTDNRGTYMARTTGMIAATAAYVTSIDADDRYVAGCLDYLAELLEEQNADVAMGKLIETDNLDESENSYKISQQAQYTVKISTDDQMWPRIMKWKTQEFVSYINKLYRKDVLPDFVEGDGICQGEDVLITCQSFLNVKKIVETDAPTYLYYLNPQSLTHVAFGDHDLDVIRVWDKVVDIMKEERMDLLPMAQFNRWRTDFTMITRLILVNDKEMDRKYAEQVSKWRNGLKLHWKDLVAPHAMPKSREMLVLSLRFFFTPTKCLLRLGRKLTKQDTSVILHSGDKR